LLAIAALIAAQTASAVTVTRGPYLQTPTPNGITVRWRTDVATSSRVKVGPAPGSLATNFDDATAVTDHIVTVTVPVGVSYYSVGSIVGAFVGDDADHFFDTSHPLNRSPFRIWSIGDAGFPGAPLDAVRDAFKAYNGGTSATNLFLLLGDNAYGSNLLANDANYQTAVFDEHAEMLRSTPVYSTFGNHERFVAQDLTQTGDYFNMFSFPKNAEAGGVASGTEAYYSFDFRNVHFVVLDSEDYASSPAALTPMITWLQSDLAAVSGEEWVVALWHRPPYTRGLLHNSDTETNEINMRQTVLPVLEGLGVDLVLSGHSHSYERSYFINGHYGLANTFTDAFKLDLGDGDPAGNGAYRKAADAPDPNSGAVYVVNGSGSEFRPATLDHPAHLRGFLETGSLVIDVDQNVLTARFLTGTGEIHDQFSIVKGTTCPFVAATGCNAAVRGKLTMRNGKWGWKWKGGTIDSTDVGDPTGEADLAVCVYDPSGVPLLGGEILHGNPLWKPIKRGYQYRDRTFANHGFEKVKIKAGTPSLGAVVQVKGRSALPPLPAALPVTAQLINLDNGKCWSSEFSTPRTNQADRFLAVIP
jgi:hypothetical protein